MRALNDLPGTAHPERRSALICKELCRYNLDIVPLSETRLSSDGILSEPDSGYTIFYKGRPENVRREAGVGFAVKSCLVPHLSELPYGVSDRIMTLRLPLYSNRYMTMISVYLPTLVSAKLDIHCFYADLRSVLKNVYKDDKIVLMGDFNVRAGCNSGMWGSIGRHGMGKCNSNGLLLLQLCRESDLAVTNTWFRQKDKYMYKATWKHPRSGYWRILDNVIVRRKDLCDVRSVRCKRGPECWTDHRLLRAELSVIVKGQIRKADVRAPRRIDVSQLACGEKLECFHKAVEAIDLTKSTDPCVTFTKEIFEAAASTFGYVKRNHQDWFAENEQLVTSLLKEKKSLLDKMLSCAASAHEKPQLERAFKEFKARVQWELRAAKDSWWRERARQIQDSADKRDSKSLYHQLRSVYGPPCSVFAPLRTEDKTLVRNPDQVKARWHEHFKELSKI